MGKFGTKIGKFGTKIKMGKFGTQVSKFGFKIGLWCCSGFLSATQKVSLAKKAYTACGENAFLRWIHCEEAQVCLFGPPPPPELRWQQLLMHSLLLSG